MRGEILLGVIDLDSPLPGRFDDDDRAGIERVAALYADGSGHAQLQAGVAA